MEEPGGGVVSLLEATAVEVANVDVASVEVADEAAELGGIDMDTDGEGIAAGGVDVAGALVATGAVDALLAVFEALVAADATLSGSSLPEQATKEDRLIVASPSQMFLCDINCSSCVSCASAATSGCQTALRRRLAFVPHWNAR